MRNYSIINKNGTAEMKEKHKNELGKWHNFASRVQKNPYMRRKLHEQYGAVCQFCGKTLAPNHQVHHVDYDHCCKSEDTVRIGNPTAKRPNRTIAIPDCERCSCETPGAFADCADRLRPVCSVCNMIIDKIQKKGAMQTVQGGE